MQKGTFNKARRNPDISEVMPSMKAWSRGYWEKWQEMRLLDCTGLSAEDLPCHSKEVGFYPVASG